MFENQQNQPQSNQPKPAGWPSNQPSPSGPRPAGPAPYQAPRPVQPTPAPTPMREPDDIFSNVNTGGQTAPSRPGFEREVPLAVRQKKSKLIPLILVAAIVILLICGGVLAYLNYIQPMLQNANLANNANVNAENINVNLNENANTNVPAAIDSDSDGLSDAEEAVLGTNPNKADTDNDGLLDKDETQVYHTNPLNPDTDGDGYLDGVEVTNGYDPNGPGKLVQ